MVSVRETIIAITTQNLISNVFADAHQHYVITAGYFIPELAKITGRDLGFHFDT